VGLNIRIEEKPAFKLISLYRMSMWGSLKS